MQNCYFVSSVATLRTLFSKYPQSVVCPYRERKCFGSIQKLVKLWVFVLISNFADRKWEDQIIRSERYSVFLGFKTPNFVVDEN